MVRKKERKSKYEVGRDHHEAAAIYGFKLARGNYDILLVHPAYKKLMARDLVHIPDSTAADQVLLGVRACYTESSTRMDLGSEAQLEKMVNGIAFIRQALRKPALKLPGKPNWYLMRGQWAELKERKRKN